MHKFAIVGCGEIALQHAEQISKTGRLQAVCDILPERADRFAAQFKANAYHHIDELLARETDVEIVCICTPNGSHAEHCIKSLQHGKHVLCEAPLCLTTAAAWQMVETEKFCRRKLVVVNPVFFDKQIREHKKRPGEGHGRQPAFYIRGRANISEEQYRDWKGKAFPGGGPLYTEFSQLIAALAWLFGPIEEIKGLAGSSANIQGLEMEDTGVVSLKMKSGVLGNLHWSLGTGCATESSLTVYGEEEAEVLAIGSGNSVAGKAAIYEEIYTHFLQSLNRNEPSDIYESMKAVEAIEKIYKALSPNPSFSH